MPRLLAAFREHRIAIAATVVTITLLGFLLACVLLLPTYLVERTVGQAAKRLSATERLKAENDIRITLIQGLGGMLVLLGASIGAIVTLRQVAVNREGQITDRFTHAIDQLGHEAVDVRVGGIYALERIAKNSTMDHDAIFAILSSFVRRKAQFANSSHGDSGEESYAVYSDSGLRTRSADVQAALTVLTRSPLRDKLRFVTLDSLDFRGAMLPDANLSHISLVDVHLDSSWLRNANLQKASLTRAHLRKCVLAQASLEFCNLDRADMREADLEGADLKEASLVGADMRDANLIDANLRGAIASSETQWPEGINPASFGVVQRIR